MSAAPAPASPPASRLSAYATGSPVGAQVRLTWPPVFQASSYTVYRDGLPLLHQVGLTATDYCVLSGETHTYRLAASGPRSAGLPGTPVTVQVPAGLPDVVYADSLGNGWAAWGWADLDLNCAAPVRSGRAIRVTPGAWQALYLHHADTDTRRWAALTFWIHGAARRAGRSFASALCGAGVPQAAVALPPPAAGQWRQVTLPLAALGVGRGLGF